MKKLHPKTIEKIAEAVCGKGDGVRFTEVDRELAGVVEYLPAFETDFPLREQPELVAFLRRSGMEFEVREEIHDRKEFVLGLLTSKNCTSELERVITGLADPRENDDDQEIFQKCFTRLNDILRLEGLRVEIRGVEPRLVECEATMDRPTKGVIFDVPPDFGRLVQKEEMASTLAFRWEEAQRCVQAEAYLAAVVMMGSLLEGVLLAKMQVHPEDANTAKSAPRDTRRDRAKPFAEWRLAEMIQVAHERGWLSQNVKAFSVALREFRNLVHPSAEFAGVERPDQDTCDVCQQVVVVAVRQLLKEQ